MRHRQDLGLDSHPKSWIVSLIQVPHTSENQVIKFLEPRPFRPTSIGDRRLNIPWYKLLVYARVVISDHQDL
jgi:hypothetical protein